MQNPVGASAAADLGDAAEERAILQQAVIRLKMRTTAASQILAPTSRLTKLGPEDDVGHTSRFSRGRHVEKNARRTSGPTFWPPSSLQGGQRNWRVRTEPQNRQVSTRYSSKRFWRTMDIALLPGPNRSTAGGLIPRAP